MKTAERIVMVLIILVLIGGGVWLYYAIQYKQQAVRDAVARGEYEIPKDKEPEVADSKSWQEHFPVLVPITIGSTTVAASVADSMPERIKGLSGTPYLPEGVVKLFAFGVAGEQAIWMKDMNYPLDIIWVAEDGEIVHLEENISPDTYPRSFASPTPAFFVIEANAGFIASSSVALGDDVVIVLDPVE